MHSRGWGWSYAQVLVPSPTPALWDVSGLHGNARKLTPRTFAQQTSPRTKLLPVYPEALLLALRLLVLLDAIYLTPSAGLMALHACDQFSMGTVLMASQKHDPVLMPTLCSHRAKQNTFRSQRSYTVGVFVFEAQFKTCFLDRLRAPASDIIGGPRHAAPSSGLTGTSHRLSTKLFILTH